MLTELKAGMRLWVPPYDDESWITLEKLASFRSQGRIIFNWIDSEGRCWAESYLLERGQGADDEPTNSSPEALTAERKSTHGDWAEQSRVFDNLMFQLTSSTNWSSGKLNHMQRASLTNIAQKMSRICTGDPNVEDHWDDIQGYAHLGKGEYT